MKRTRRILYGTDFSPASSPAFRKALELARDGHSDLVIAYVYEFPPWLGLNGFVAANVYDEVDRSMVAAAEKKLGALVARAKKAGVRAKKLLLRGGTTHEELCRAAKSQRADFLVLGTHGRTGVKKLLIGSVVARVLPIAPCPVLTVRK
jgi:nucleotide-binding universal stress UspA family protein